MILTSVVRLFAEAETGVLDELMRELCTIDPDGFVAMRWKGIQTCRRADKMYGSILGILAQKISNFSFSGAQRAVYQIPNQIDFACNFAGAHRRISARQRQRLIRLQI